MDALGKARRQECAGESGWEGGQCGRNGPVGKEGGRKGMRSRGAGTPHHLGLRKQEDIDFARACKEEPVCRGLEQSSDVLCWKDALVVLKRPCAGAEGRSGRAAKRQVRR